MMFYNLARTACIAAILLYTTSALALAPPGDLQIFENEEEFRKSCQGLRFENFEDTNAPPNSSVECPNPFDSNTNNECFSQGALLPGFAITGVGSSGLDNQIEVVTPPRGGTTQVGVGANSLLDDTVVTFDPLVKGAGLLLYASLASSVFIVELFGLDGVSLGSTMVEAGPGSGTFIGFQTDERIESIRMTNASIGGPELIYELSFGPCESTRPIPTISEWGMIALAAVLGLLGAFYAIRRRTAVDT